MVKTSKRPAPVPTLVEPDIDQHQQPDLKRIKKDHPSSTLISLRDIAESLLLSTSSLATTSTSQQLGTKPESVLAKSFESAPKHTIKGRSSDILDLCNIISDDEEWFKSSPISPSLTSSDPKSPKKNPRSPLPPPGPVLSGRPLPPPPRLRKFAPYSAGTNILLEYYNHAAKSV